VRGIYNHQISFDNLRVKISSPFLGSGEDLGRRWFLDEALSADAKCGHSNSPPTDELLLLRHPKGHQGSCIAVRSGFSGQKGATTIREAARSEIVYKCQHLLGSIFTHTISASH
jgi:hypothetical protein